MNNNPLVTIYMPTHNRLPLLKRALLSIFAQTYQPLEVIVVDDGSSDGETPEFLMDLALKKQLIYLRNDTPKGACYSRNRAIEKASGEYITGLDDDDAFEPQRVERLMALMQTGKYACVTSSIVERTAQGSIARPFNTGLITLNELLHSNKLGNQVLTKTEYLRAIEGFDVNLPAFQDYDTWVRLVAEYGPGFKSPNLDYIWYTDHEMARISDASDKKYQAYRQFCQKHLHLMNAKHKKSMAVLGFKLGGVSYTGQPLNLYQLLMCLHWQNKKEILALFLNRYLSWLKKPLDSWRAGS